MAFTYDLYIHQGGRWVLEASFGVDRRSDALHLARRIEDNRSADGIQLIREQFDPETGHVERSTVYNTWRRRKAKAWREARGDDPGPYAGVLAETEPEGEDEGLLTEPVYAESPSLGEAVAPSPRVGPVVAKLCAIAFASFGLASLITAVHGGAAAGIVGF